MRLPGMVYSHFEEGTAFMSFSPFNSQEDSSSDESGNEYSRCGGEKQAIGLFSRTAPSSLRRRESSRRQCFGLARAELCNLLCKRPNLFTAKVVTDPLSDLARRQETSRFDNRSLSMDPLWLNFVQPGTLDRLHNRGCGRLFWDVALDWRHAGSDFDAR